jgi:hypothetical protein
MVEMPMHLPFGVLNGVTQRARFFVGVAGAGAVQSQTDEPTVLESLVALGLVQSAGQSQPRGFRVHARGAVGQGVIPKGAVEAQLRADRRVGQPFQA